MNKLHPAGAGVPLALAALFCFAAAPATAANITIVNSSCPTWTTAPDGQGNLVITCETTPPPSGAPSCTSLSANTTSLGVGGGNVTLTANGCTADSTFEWTATTATASAPLQATTPLNVNAQAGIGITATTTFTVKPVKDGLKGSAQPVTVQVASAPPPPPPPTGAISCAGFAGTAVLDATVPANGAANKSYYPSAYKGWGSQAALVIRFTAPPADSAFQFSFEAYGEGQTGFHNFMVASEPCVFDSTAASAMGGQASTKTGFVVPLSSSGKPNPYGSYIRSLTPGQTYYINAAHKAGGKWSCSTAACDMLITVTNK